jgi:hypothetical protein
MLQELLYLGPEYETNRTLFEPQHKNLKCMLKIGGGFKIFQYQTSHVHIKPFKTVLLSSFSNLVTVPFRRIPSQFLLSRIRKTCLFPARLNIDYNCGQTQAYLLVGYFICRANLRWLGGVSCNVK